MYDVSIHQRETDSVFPVPTSARGNNFMNHSRENGLTSTTPASIADPIATFADFNLKPEIADAIRDMGFTVPTPVQARCFERAISGGDAIIMAQTGTGKTAAFGLPIVQTLNVDRKAVQALILVPTRELALQVSREIAAIAKKLSVTCAPVYGGTSFTAQVDQLKAGAQVVVGTPGRVLDHIRRGTLRLDALTTFVLDEADEMLSMGFEKELSEIMENLPAKRQTMLFSATIPDDIRRLAGRYMSDALTISVSGDHVGAQEINHFVYLSSGLNRTADLVRIIEAEQPESALVFCNTRDETQLVAAGLQQAGYSALHISSDLSQGEREKVMDALRRRQVRFLVATDVAARGIDISHLSHVINYSFPDSLERYIHRTGRTGRQGRQGDALSLITPQDIGSLYMLRLTYKIFPVEKVLPTAEGQRRLDELSRLARLREDFAGEVIDDMWMALADRVIQSVDAPRLVSALLKRYFDGAPATRPISVTEPMKEAPPTFDDIDPGEDEADIPSEDELLAGRTSVAPDLSDPSGSTDIFIDAGRADGLRISALMKDVVEKSGLQRTDIGKVRMLTRSTFISVPNPFCERVFKVLQTLEQDGRKFKVAYAEES